MSINHKAIVCRLKSVRNHSNADRLLIANADGNQVIVGLDQKEGDLGIYFPVDSALSEEFLSANDLVARHDPDTGLKVGGGYFGKDGRVKAQRLRGEKSEGFWTTLDSVYNLKADLPARWVSLEEGVELDEIQGVRICHKYVTPATRDQARKNSFSLSSKFFHRHVDTNHLSRNMRDIPDNAAIIITEKLHGTSGRLGYLPFVEKKTFWKTLKSYLSTKNYEDLYSSYKHIIGSRNMVQGVAENFNGESYRLSSIESLLGNLRKGETIYYEIVGYENSGKPIMGSVDSKSLDKSARKQYGLKGKMEFSYGCNPVAQNRNDVYVYRITQQNQDGDLTELSWNQLVGRCKELRVKTVPFVSAPGYFSKQTGSYCINGDNLIELSENLCVGLSSIDESHIKEGVVIRWEHEGKVGFLKHKSFDFKCAEGHVKSQDNYVDVEEAS